MKKKSILLLNLIEIFDMASVFINFKVIQLSDIKLA